MRIAIGRSINVRILLVPFFLVTFFIAEHLQLPAQASAGSNTATVTNGNIILNITLVDAKKMRLALLEALRLSKLETRLALIRELEHQPARIEDNRVMFSNWLLQFRGNNISAVTRYAQSRNIILNYVARFTHHDSQWEVMSLEAEEVLRR